MGWYQDFDYYHRSVRSSALDTLMGVSGMDANDKVLFRAQMQNVPLIGDVFKDEDNYNYYSDYLKNRGLSWSDVKYPTRLNMGVGMSGVNFVSSNIRSLYK